MPYIHTITLEADLTAKLVERCRAEKTTVHALIVAAASRVRSTLSSEEFVRVVTPFSLRSLTGAGGDCVDYFASARTGMVPHNGNTLWDQACSIGAEIAGARSTAGVVAASAALEQLVPVNADADTVEAFILGALSYEIVVSNLGILDIHPSGPFRPKAVWGPLLLSQAVGEQISGVVTYR
ncbi:hypothetical protein ACFWP5_09615 [Streptomyces sp. NPDC058469]|uniref:hypothetical protein n=1 Tax=Streptomyces sp. NPDC058469 TaxID=3346514 RepID=UPI003654767C